MEDIQYLQATLADVDMLVDYRMHFSHELVGKYPDAEETVLRNNMHAYFTREINQNYFCWYATIDGQVAAIAGMGIRVVPGNVKNPSGIWGYIMSVYTVPQHRRKGLSGQLIRHLVATGRQQGITAFELHATKAGEPVYIKQGFKIHNEPTYRLFV